MLKCPYCGSARLQTTGGENGNPFDRRPEKTVCLDCGRTLLEEEAPAEKVSMPDLSAAGRMMKELEEVQKTKPIVVIEMTAKGGGITRTAKAELPYEDGSFSLGDYDYPFPRFNRIIIDGDRLDLDGEISKLTNNVLETEKHYTAYAPDKHPVQETVTIKIYIDKK